MAVTLPKVFFLIALILLVLAAFGVSAAFVNLIVLAAAFVVAAWLVS